MRALVQAAVISSLLVHTSSAPQRVSLHRMATRPPLHSLHTAQQQTVNRSTSALITKHRSTHWVTGTLSGSFQYIDILGNTLQDIDVYQCR